MMGGLSTWYWYTPNAKQKMTKGTRMRSQTGWANATGLGGGRHGSHCGNALHGKGPRCSRIGFGAGGATAIGGATAGAGAAVALGPAGGGGGGSAEAGGGAAPS